MKYYLVLDVGGTFIKYALMEDEANILEKGKEPTPWYEDYAKEDFYQVLDRIVEKYRKQAEGIAISMPGMLDSTTGYCRTAGYVKYLAGISVGRELKQRFGLPVSIENDGKCAALAEYWQGSLKGYQNGAVVILGSGVGGGLILGGELYRGRGFTAGEYSYLCSDYQKPFDINSYWGIVSGASGLAAAVARYTGEDVGSYDGVKIFTQANEGRREVLKGLKEFTDVPAVQIYNLNILLDMDMFAIGGGISRQPLLFEYLQRSIDELDEKNPLRIISSYIPKPKITNCKFYNDANLIGALYHYKKQKGEAK